MCGKEPHRNIYTRRTHAHRPRTDFSSVQLHAFATTCLEENMEKRSSKDSRADVLANVRSSEEHRENSSRTQNKVLSFSIEAILSSPHPKRASRNNVQNKHIQENPQKPDQTRTALNTLVEFTSTTLKDAGDERSKNQKESK